MKRTFIAYAVLTGGLVLSSTLAARRAQPFPTSVPEKQGLSSEAILAFVDRLEKEIDAVHSVMIVRHGMVIAQGWWAPYDAASPHVMHSLSKSFTSTAIGLAIGEGKLSLDDTVISFFPEDTPDNPSWQLKDMRVRDLMRMTTGHRREPLLFREKGSWVRAFLHSDVEFQPGTLFKYNTAATYMLSAVIQRVTGEKLVEYLDPRLFEPLGVEKPEWDVSPEGINTGGYGLRITTEGVAKLGQLYLQKGVWQGKRILSEAWVDEATSKQTSNGSNPDNDWAQGYGYQFWRCRHNCYRGDGASGQFCIVMPEHDAVVAITSGANDMAGIMNAVWEVLLPVMQPTPLQADDQASSALAAKMMQVSLPFVHGEKSSPLSGELDGKTFRLSKNEVGAKFVSFDLHGDEHRISVGLAHGVETFHLGVGEFLSGQADQQLPYTQGVRSPIGASGAWIKPNEYQAKIYFRESPASITYDFRFEDGELTWTSKLRHALFGPRGQLATLQGQAE
jgi:CubicO group peptidase (beta-lactamase class C family)